MREFNYESSPSKAVRASIEDGVLRNSAQRQSFAKASPNEGGYLEASPSGTRRRIAAPIPTVAEENDGFTLTLTEVQTKDNSSPNKRRWATSTNPQALIMNNRLPGPP